MYQTVDVRTDDNYKAWVAMQVIELPGFARNKRAQVLQDESQKKKHKHNLKNGLIVLVFRPFMLCFSFRLYAL